MKNNFVNLIKWITLFFLIATLLFLLAGRVFGYDSRDLRINPQGQTGIIRAGWGAESGLNLLVDVWINPEFGADGRPLRGPSFILPPGGSYEWVAEFGQIHIYAEAWTWIALSRGVTRVLMAKTCQPLVVKITPGRKFLAGGGYDWEVVFLGTQEKRDGIICLTAASR